MTADLFGVARRMTDQLALDLEPLNLEPIAPGLTIQERFAEFDRRKAPSGATGRMHSSC
jgi:hypothetical protein